MESEPGRRASASVARIVGGVVAGLVLAATLTIAINVFLAGITVPTSTLFLAVTLPCALADHFAGGYVCAAIARDTVPATAALIVLASGLMLTSVAQTFSQMPSWYSAGMLIGVPAALWWGARTHAATAKPRPGRGAAARA
jgi:hypothetical protein